MQKDQIVYFQALNMGWVISERVLKIIDNGSFSLRQLGEVSINPEGRPGADTEMEPQAY